MINGEEKLISKIFFRMTKRYKRHLVVIFLLVMVSFGLSLISPRIESKIIDRGILSGDLKNLVFLVVFVIFIKLSYECVTFAQNYLKTILNIDIREEMSIKAFNHILRLKIQYIKKYGLYKIVKDVDYELTMITQIFGDQIIECLFELTKIIGYFVGLMFINWKLTLFVVILMPFKYVVSKIINGIRERNFEKLLIIQKKISEWQSNIFDGIYEIKLWNLYRKQEQKYSELLRESNSIVKSINILDGLDSLINNVAESIIFNLLYIIGGIFIWKNYLTLGEIIAFITFSQYLFQPISVLLQFKATIAETLPAFRSFLHFLKMEEENIYGSVNVKKVNSIEFRDVTFSYGNELILNRISFTIHKGEKVIITGKNGSGKSSILALLLRYYEPDSGQILINDIDISRIPIDKYRMLFSCVSQDVFLFNDTIKNNVFMDIEQGCEMNKHKQLLSFIDKFEEKEDKIVGKNGIYLSGGEKQRIAFARCISKNAEILLADEVTSNCDVACKKEIQDILENSKFNIIFLITHDRHIFSDFQKIIVIENGRIIAIGTYEEVNKFLN